MRRGLLVGLLLAGFGGIAGFCGVGIYGSRWITAEEFRTHATVDLPPGTPKADVVSWLSAKGIDMTKVGVGLSGEAVAGEFENETSNRFLGVSVIRFHFFFDEQDRLTGLTECYEFVYEL
jgi:hypothetical protein